MLLKKTVTALGANCNGLLCDSFLATSITSWRPSRPNHQGTQTTISPPGHCTRSYAAVHAPRDSPRASRSYKDRTTVPWPSAPNPTPYDVFGLARGAPYSKTRFYELVKLYHPDRLRHSHDDGLPEPTKLERYRLVVAANDILCDPVKRRLYDLYGLGWVEQPDARHNYRAVDRQWRQQPGNASANATWEDWERWYQARDGKKPEPVYMSNAGFAAAIAILVVIGAWGQATRAGNHSRSLVEMREDIHQEVSSDLRRRQMESNNLTREGRLDSFLKHREGWDYDRPCGPVRPAHESAADRGVK